MKLLLDTHVWLWAQRDEMKKLGAKGRRLLESSSNELWLSPVSVWETALLVDKKRLQIRGTFEAWIELALQRMPVTEAPFNMAVALASRRVQIANQDPADRFLAATAAVFELTLITADRRLLAGRGFKHVACG